MLIVISPAKTLDFDCADLPGKGTLPDFLGDAEYLVSRMRTYTPRRLSKLMDISADLAQLNVERFAQWEPVHAGARVRPAVLAFKGDVYVGMEADRFGDDDLEFAQRHLRILSGLYGLLRPLDMIQPYRLEMGTSVKLGRKPNLYAYWGDKLSKKLNAALEAQGDDVLVNLASDEYFDAVSRKALKARVIKPVFMDNKNGQYKVISFWAKKARGMMAAYILLHRLRDPEAIKGFRTAGYEFNAAMSQGDQWVFTREAAAAGE